MGKSLNIEDSLDNGRLVVVSEFSHGEFSEMYGVKKIRPNIECLLKVNLPHDMLDENIAQSSYNFSKEDHMKRSEHEFEMIKRLSHPNIASVEDIIEFESDYQGVKKHYKGILFHPLPRTSSPYLSTLRSCMVEFEKDIESYPQRAILFTEIAPGIFDALAEMSDKEIVHRDLRPENVLVDKNQTPHLVDFGYACPLSEVGGIWGSRTYAPPEIYIQSGDLDSDYWHVGLMFFELLTGQHLIDNSSNPIERRTKIIEKVKLLNTKQGALDFFEMLLSDFHRIDVFYNDLMFNDNQEINKIYGADDWKHRFKQLLALTAYCCQPSSFVSYSKKSECYLNFLSGGRIIDGILAATMHHPQNDTKDLFYKIRCNMEALRIK